MNLTEINIYPVKSLHGIGVAEARVEDRGLENDRRWMLVDDKGKFMTQREFPVMARLHVAVSGGKLEVVFEGDRLRVASPSVDAEHRTVKVWSSSVKAATFSEEVDAWFSKAIGTGCHLVAMTSASKRTVNPYYAVRKFRDQVSFADGYPFLLIGEGSLADLNSRLDEPVPMSRFRPTFVASCADPFIEDTWKLIRIGTTVFHVVKPCGRCVITTIDQTEGVFTGKEPLRTLASYRTQRGNANFGQNLIADRSGGIVSVGDEVEVLEYR